MTKEEIQAMKPGRELDALVAEKVMGWKLQGIDEWTDEKYVVYEMEEWKPSSDISAAWEVVEKYKTMEIKKFITDPGLWFCEIKEKIWHRTYAETAPLAICRAALLACLEGK